MSIPNITLNDGHTIPQLGFGTWEIDKAEAAEKVEFAIKSGYHHIDGAKIYGNEAEVGAGIAKSGLKREELFLTTKLWNADQGYDSALAACAASMERLKADYLNLYLIHWPCPDNKLYLDSWKALIELQKQGKTRSVGVSNFRIEDLEHIIAETGVTPAVNQIELHPYFQQAELRAFHKKHGIATVAYSPLGRGKALEEPVLKDIAAKHGKSVGQIILRWQMQMGNITIPKSRTESRIAENIAIFDFALDAADMAAIAALDSAEGRILPAPGSFHGV